MKRVFCFVVAFMIVASLSFAAEPFTLVTESVSIHRAPLFAVTSQLTVIQRPLSNFGLTEGICYALTNPTLANTGLPPADGELCVILASGSAPSFRIYDDSAATWQIIGFSSASGGTDNTIPVWDASGNLEDSVLDDVSGQMIITGSASQLSIPAGTLADPPIVFTDDDDGTGTGIYLSAADVLSIAANGIEHFTFSGSGGVNFSRVLLWSVDGTTSLPGFAFIAQANSGMYRIGASNVGFTVDSALVFDLEDTNSAGAGANLATVSSTLGIMDGTDTVNGFSVEITSVNHTGVGNVLTGITVPAITGDAQAQETALLLESGYDVGIASVSAIFDRQDFDEPVFEIQDDFTAKSVTDAEVNLAMGHGGILFEYRNEQTVTVSHIIFTATGGIDLGGDGGDVGNEGLEIYLGTGQNTTTGYLVAQTDQLCFTVNATIALIAGTDQFVIGWRNADAYVADNIYTGYVDYAVIGVNNIDGSIFALSETTANTGTDDSETNWANAETKTLKVCIDGAGLTHHYLDGTIVAEDDGSDPNDFAMASGTVMNPFISYLDVSGTDAQPVINWWEITGS